MRGEGRGQAQRKVSIVSISLRDKPSWKALSEHYSKSTAGEGEAGSRPWGPTLMGYRLKKPRSAGMAQEGA